MRNDYTSEAFKKWLNKLQQESWQLELIISGFAIFGLFTAFDPIRENLSIAQNSGNKYFYIPWVIVLISCLILIFNLILHVILRGLWIGALGLRYVSGDIDYNSLKYSQKFTNYLKNKIGSFDKYIARLEDYCSILFALSFLMIFYVLSLFMIFFFIGFVGYLLDKLLFLSVTSLEVISIIIGVILTFSILLLLIDFIGQGVLKRKKWTSKVYFPIYWFFSFITLSFLYRPLVYNFLDNKFGKRLILILVPTYLALFLATSINYKTSNYLSLNSKTSENIINTNNYEDLIGEKSFIKEVSIPSKIITTSYLKIFITNSYGMDDTIFSFNEDLKPEEDFRGINFDISFTGKKYLSPSKRDSISKEYLKTFNKVYKIYVDDKEYEKAFLMSKNSRDQLGFETVITIDSLSVGRHFLNVKRLIKPKNDSTKTIKTIPFWYYPN